MYIKDLIKKLQELYDSYDDEYKAEAGEPEIMIDRFNKVKGTPYFAYAGYDGNVNIERTDCWTHDIFDAFGKDVDDTSDVLYYNGSNVENFSREDLLSAIKTLAKINDELRQQLRDK